jgi:hypothetical protein
VWSNVVLCMNIATLLSHLHTLSNYSQCVHSSTKCFLNLANWASSDDDDGDDDDDDDDNNNNNNNNKCVKILAGIRIVKKFHSSCIHCIIFCQFNILCYCLDMKVKEITVFQCWLIVCNIFTCFCVPAKGVCLWQCEVQYSKNMLTQLS